MMLKRIDKEDEGYILGKTVRKVLETPLMSTSYIVSRTNEKELEQKVLANLRYDFEKYAGYTANDEIGCLAARELILQAYAIGFLNGGKYYRNFVWDKLAHILNRNYYKKLRKKQREAVRIMKEAGYNVIDASKCAVFESDKQKRRVL